MSGGNSLEQPYEESMFRFVNRLRHTYTEINVRKGDTH